MYPLRFRIIILVFILLFFGIIVRLFQLQVIESEIYQGISHRRRIATTLLETTRGSIFDRNGKVLAVDQPTFDVSVLFKNLLHCYLNRTEQPYPFTSLKIHEDEKKQCRECRENQDVWLERLSQLLGIPQAELLNNTRQIIEKVERLKQSVERRAGKKVRIKEEIDYHPVVADIPWEKVIQIETRQADFPGIRIVPRLKRVYPEQKLASHILGYIGKLTMEEWREYREAWNNYVLASTGAETLSLLYDGYMENDNLGRDGIEAQYEEELRGMRGKRFEEITYKSSQMERVIVERPSISGNDVYLTLDSRIQAYAEKSLGTHAGSVIVVDPRTGEILAMANNPRFNPNTISEDFNRLINNPSKPFLNRAIQGALPPGSIFKAITAIAPLSSGVLNTQTAFECHGYVRHRNVTLRCASRNGHGLISLEDAITYSCNVFFYEVAKAFGRDIFYDYARLFGIGERTGIDLPHERSGNMPQVTATIPAMNIAIGQGRLLTTPLQMVRVYAAIANGGTLVQPHVLSKVINSQGEVIRRFEATYNQKLPIHPSILNSIQASLRDVVTRGTARGKGLHLYKAAGKTGTAETGRKGDYHSWFVGYAPYDNPRYCFIVLVEHTPKSSAEIACPIAAELLSYLFPEAHRAS
ncbi:MAG: penicillin-binding protein 2 [Candidatus Loosdrechtia sp.]|uniref:peptidoglycan D,D-transpeptidase FtsI family protein n=1 Tax=Candidatus Loosdrechtia sp. TaxID=3101272 RepID=UPI003A645224|nr:MAG: penicillin-binding protein 2 [Candidatus Jettenia sp. AMX2]